MNLQPPIPQPDSDFRLLDWAFKQQCGRPGANLVLIWMARIANRSHKFYMCLDNLAALTGIARKTLSGHLRYLCKQGYIKCVSRSLGKPRGYEFCVTREAASQNGLSKRPKRSSELSQNGMQNPKESKLNPKTTGLRNLAGAKPVSAHLEDALKSLGTALGDDDENTAL